MLMINSFVREFAEAMMFRETATLLNRVHVSNSHNTSACYCELLYDKKHHVNKEYRERT